VQGGEGEEEKGLKTVVTSGSGTMVKHTPDHPRFEGLSTLAESRCCWCREEGGRGKGLKTFVSRGSSTGV
jgi:hypothetical protein